MIAERGFSVSRSKGDTAHSIDTSSGRLTVPTAVAICSHGAVRVTTNLAAGSLAKLAVFQNTPTSRSTGPGVLNTPSSIEIDAGGASGRRAPGTTAY